ncbi:hypothetical protein ACLOJK_036151 [Asimina triloba]
MDYDQHLSMPDCGIRTMEKHRWPAPAVAAAGKKDHLALGTWHLASVIGVDDAHESCPPTTRLIANLLHTVQHNTTRLEEQRFDSFNGHVIAKLSAWKGGLGGSVVHRSMEGSEKQSN